jgi:hypothetical protein
VELVVDFAGCFFVGRPLVADFAALCAITTLDVVVVGFAAAVVVVIRWNSVVDGTKCRAANFVVLRGCVVVGAAVSGGCAFTATGGFVVEVVVASLATCFTGAIP